MSSYFSYLHLAIKGAKVQKKSSPMWAHDPPPLWKQGPQSRWMGPKNRIRNRCQKQIPSPSKRVPSGPTQINPGPQKLSPQGPGNTHASLPHFSCPQVQKKWPGPKNMYRSKKRLPRSKKHASLVRPSSGKKCVACWTSAPVAKSFSCNQVR